eukprot:CAMPEP_0172731820 /NCGR_PEP_ID=MMETSP1074-20121228/102535_1 /TAXON_ID=2916 /ORGANISM="Ceratium fusus, Strain PA161109" /LENGTH=95 /DNA_ID=CAMNT_0013559949 /DNA_START=439 /DNA_END=727 /DNA_ORIENTATION=+
MRPTQPWDEPEVRLVAAGLEKRGGEPIRLPPMRSARQLSSGRTAHRKVLAQVLAATHVSCCSGLPWENQLSETQGMAAVESLECHPLDVPAPSQI